MSSSSISCDTASRVVLLAADEEARFSHTNQATAAAVDDEHQDEQSCDVDTNMQKGRCGRMKKDQQRRSNAGGAELNQDSSSSSSSSTAPNTARYEDFYLVDSKEDHQHGKRSTETMIAVEEEEFSFLQHHQRGEHQPQMHVVDGHTFTLSSTKNYDFSNSKILGVGTYGVVASALNAFTGQPIAIKRIRPYANDEWDAKHALREIRALKLLSPHPNIITLCDLSIFEDKSELYMMMELMDCDLKQIIDSRQVVSEAHIKCFAKQLLEGIKAMHSLKIFHRDLKPGNILVNKRCELRITDFGFARFMDSTTLAGKNSDNPMTDYVVTRWYRSPELLLAPLMPYTAALDMWSIGCILAELVSRTTLFPGKTQAMQIQAIFEVVGYDNVGELGFIVQDGVASFLHEHCIGYRSDMRKVLLYGSEERPWACMNPSDALVLLISELLKVNPKKRLTATEALNHPFLKDVKCLYDYSAPSLVHRPPPGYFDFDSTKSTMLFELRRMIEMEVSHRETIVSPRQTSGRKATLSIGRKNAVFCRSFSRRSFDGSVPADEEDATVRRNIVSSAFPALSRKSSRAKDGHCQTKESLKTDTEMSITQDSLSRQVSKQSIATTVQERSKYRVSTIRQPEQQPQQQPQQRGNTVSKILSGAGYAIIASFTRKNKNRNYGVN